MKSAGLFSCTMLLLSAACGGDASGRPDPHAKPVTDSLYELDLTHPLAELGSDFFGNRKPGLHEAVSRVHELAAEPLARGLFVRLSDMAGHAADIDEWAGAFEAFRAQKKPVHCQFDDLDNLGFALASHCDALSITPAGSLGLVGLAAQTLHGADLLNRVGVQAELFQVGKYKGAAEPFTRNDMSPELRQNLGELLDDLEGAFAGHLAARTKRDAAALKAVLDRGPYDAEGALAEKLVDAVAFDDEARAKAKAAANARAVVRLFPAREHASLSFRDVLDAFSDDKPKPDARPSLATVYLLGDIVDGDEPGAERAVSGPFVREMRKLGDDRDVRAVLLRIESPGGSALASDLMWHAVRRVASRKPVIVSLGDMAASGGYYVACAGSYLFASPGSVVGSIGVVGGKMVARELGEHLGVHSSTITRGAHAAWLSVLSPFSVEERGILEHMLTRTYDRFVERIALGRKKPIASFANAAEGRVMGGERALKLGLVDAVGDLSAALEYARKQGKLPKDAPIRQWPEESDPMRTLAAQFGVHAAAAVGVSLGQPDTLGDEFLQALRGTFAYSLARNPGAPVAVLPFVLQIR